MRQSPAQPLPGHMQPQRARGGVDARDGLEVERVFRPPVLGESDMVSAVQKIKLSPSRDIPFNKLVLSQSNVRRVPAILAKAA
jgi:hypothetical protein